MKKGRYGTMTHDYKRNGTTTLFAALNMLDGTVIGQCMPRHRHREFLRFLKTIDERTLPNLDLRQSGLARFFSVEIQARVQGGVYEMRKKLRYSSLFYAINETPVRPFRSPQLTSETSTGATVHG
jgi:hypothetical protein